jgi:20S proteasome subunit beta 2
MGSGSLAAMAVFETKWKPKMARQEAIDLVVQAIYAGIFNDLGSGSNCDVCVIEASGTEMLRNYAMPNERVAKELNYTMRRGATAWIVSHGNYPPPLPSSAKANMFFLPNFYRNKISKS